MGSVQYLNTMHLQTICLLILLGVLTIANETFSQNPVVNSETESSSVVSKNSQNLQKRPRSDVHRPARQQRPQSGFGGLLSGLLGTVTQTADSSECPGKCIHALASLLCGQVREDIQCPQGNMRCCVEKPRKNKKKPSQSQKPLNNDVNDGQTTEKTVTTNIKKVKKTKRKSTTEQSVEKPLRKQVSAYNLL